MIMHNASARALTCAVNVSTGNMVQGIIINGCIRDSEDVGKVPFGIKALNTHPIKSSKRDAGLRDVPVSFGGVTVQPGDWIYADRDGILVSKEAISV